MATNATDSQESKQKLQGYLQTKILCQVVSLYQDIGSNPAIQKDFMRFMAQNSELDISEQLTAYTQNQKAAQILRYEDVRGDKETYFRKSPSRIYMIDLNNRNKLILAYDRSAFTSIPHQFERTQMDFSKIGGNMRTRMLETIGMERHGSSLEKFVNQAVEAGVSRLSKRFNDADKEWITKATCQILATKNKMDMPELEIGSVGNEIPVIERRLNAANRLVYSIQQTLETSYEQAVNQLEVSAKSFGQGFMTPDEMFKPTSNEIKAAQFGQGFQEPLRSESKNIALADTNGAFVNRDGTLCAPSEGEKYLSPQNRLYPIVRDTTAVDLKNEKVGSIYGIATDGTELVVGKQGKSKVLMGGETVTPYLQSANDMKGMEQFIGMSMTEFAKMQNLQTPNMEQGQSQQLKMQQEM